MYLLYISISGSIILLLGTLFYNNLIFKRNNVKAALSSVDVMLKKRFDLIPNLISTVKGYMNHEKELLKKITKIRSEASQENGSREKFSQSNKLTALLGQLFISVENYPDLKSSANFLELQTQLERTEEDIAAARRAYNATVKVYNDAVQMFPQNCVAVVFRFKKADLFEADVPEVNVKKLLHDSRQ